MSLEQTLTADIVHRDEGEGRDAADGAAHAEGGAHEQEHREGPRARSRAKSCRSCRRSSSSGAIRSNSSPRADARTWPTRSRRRSSCSKPICPPSASDEEIERRSRPRSPKPARRGPKDMGKVMKAVMAALAGKTVDGKKVSEARARRSWPDHRSSPRLFTIFTKPSQTFWPGHPSIHFERPSQPLTILLRAPAERPEPYFFASRRRRDGMATVRLRTTFRPRTGSSRYACATDGRPCYASAGLMAEAAPRLARSAGVFGLATMTSRILGLVRDQVLAFYFGAGDAMDAFRVAFRVPNLVRDLFAEGAMSAAFVPTFTRQLTLAGPRARRGSSPTRSSTRC